MTTVLRWRGWPKSVAPVGQAIRHRLKGHKVAWTNDRDQHRCGLWFFTWETLRYAAFRTLDRLVGVIAWCVCPSTPPPPPGSSASGAGPVAFVIPVLPDLSHTFIYREILAALRQRPNSKVVCLADGEGTPVHPEARELAKHSVTVPRHGILRHYGQILWWLVTHPRRAGSVFGVYRHHGRGSIRNLLGKGPLREPDHPGRGFALASVLRRLSPSHIHVYGSTYAANVTMEAALLLDRPFSISSYVDFDFYFGFSSFHGSHTLHEQDNSSRILL